MSQQLISGMFVAAIEPVCLLRAWKSCMTLFVAGATSATLVDHGAGSIDPTNLQAFYITFGILLMATVVAWNHSLGTNPIIG